MRSVAFTFEEETLPEQRQAVMDQITQWSAVHLTSFLKPGAKSSVVRRMAHVYLNESADAEEVMKQLAAVPEIETTSISVPAERRLIQSE